MPVVAFGLLILATCGAVLAVLLYAEGPEVTADVAGIMALVLGLPALALTWVRWARRPIHATAEQVEQARESLAGWANDQWRDEALMRSLGDPAPMPTQWRLTNHAVMDCPRVIMGNDSSFTGGSDQIGQLAEKFRRLERRRLVILGGPGSGKTTLAVQLLLALLGTRVSGEPIPVLFSLAGWDPTTHPQLQGWLAERLVEDYPSLRALGPSVARALSEGGHILPILDGLDEIPPTRQPQVITALNASFTESDQLVLTSRTEQYITAITEARKVLTAAAIIEPKPLTRSQAADYLAACLPQDPGPPWRDVLDRLRDGTAEHVATVVATPLGLWLVRTVYISPNCDPRTLLSSEFAHDPAVLRRHLFDRLIPAVLRTRPASRNAHNPFRPHQDWDAHKVTSWLSFLAQYLDRAGTRDLLWWHLASHTLTRRAFGLAVGLAVGLELGLAVGLVFGIAVGAMFGLVFGLGFGLVAGLLAGLKVGLWGRNWLTDEPAYANWRIKGRTGILAQNLGAGLIGGLGVGFVFGLMDWLVDWLIFGLMGELVNWSIFSLAGMVFGLGGGLMMWVGTPSRNGWASTPQLSFKFTRTLTVAQVGIGGIGGGLGVGLLAGLVNGRELEWEQGLILGLTGGLGLGLVFLSSGAWLSYRAALFWFAAAGKLPLRLMAFLDDAHRLGLLRTTGTAYQFRHADLHHHLTHSGSSQP